MAKPENNNGALQAQIDNLQEENTKLKQQVQMYVDEINRLTKQTKEIGTGLAAYRWVAGDLSRRVQ